MNKHSNKHSLILTKILRALPYALKGAIEGVVYDDIFIDLDELYQYLMDLANRRDFYPYSTLLKSGADEISNLIHHH